MYEFTYICSKQTNPCTAVDAASQEKKQETLRAFYREMDVLREGMRAKWRQRQRDGQSVSSTGAGLCSMCTHVCIYISLHIHTYIHVHICKYACLDIHVYK